MENFISIYESMPPLNRLCECKFEHWKNTLKARFICDPSVDRYYWIQQMKNGTFASVPPVVAWKLIGAREEVVEWFQQLPCFKEPKSEENVPSSLGNICTPSEVK